MDSVMVLALLAIVAFGATFSILPLQARRERRDLAKTPEEEWEESGFAELPRREFELCRVLPTKKMRLAEFVFQDEARCEFARYLTLSRFRGSIEFGGRTATLYVQRSGLFPTKFAGKVGGTSDTSIVIRDDDHVLVELSRKIEKGSIVSRLRSGNRSLILREPRWAAFNRGTVFDGQKPVAEFRRKPGLSRKVLVALDRTLPPDLKVSICSLALLQ